MTWLIDELRFTVFPVSAIENGNGIWKKYVGEEPEQETLQPRDGIFRAKGPFLEARLLLYIDQNRAHWIYHKDPPGPYSEVSEPEEFMIGEFPEAVRPFVELVSRWLHSCPPLKRIAWGLKLIKLAESRSHGLEIAAQYLKNITIDPGNSFDFLYQINRLRKSKSGVPNLKINRLNNWEVIQHEIAAKGAAQNHPTKIKILFTGCSLTLDMSTSPEYLGPFPPEKLEVVQKELFEAACEITDYGDIP